MAETGADKASVVIKKYANRRLYNTATSSYVTLDHLCQIGEGRRRIRRLRRQERRGHHALGPDPDHRRRGRQGRPEPAADQFLRQLISFYGDNLQFLVPRYLEHTMEYFASNQDQMRSYMRDTFGGMFPFGRFEDLGKQNIAFFERALKMFASLPGRAARSRPAGGRPPTRRRRHRPFRPEVPARRPAENASIR